MSRWNVFCTLAEGPVSARHLMNSGCGSEAEPRDERAFWEAHYFRGSSTRLWLCQASIIRRYHPRRSPREHLPAISTTLSFMDHSGGLLQMALLAWCLAAEKK